MFEISCFLLVLEYKQSTSRHVNCMIECQLMKMHFYEKAKQCFLLELSGIVLLHSRKTGWKRASNERASFTRDCWMWVTKPTQSNQCTHSLFLQCKKNYESKSRESENTKEQYNSALNNPIANPKELDKLNSKQQKAAQDATKAGAICYLGNKIQRCRVNCYYKPAFRWKLSPSGGPTRWPQEGVGEGDGSSLWGETSSFS